jgi:hypothetical protein
MKPETCWPTCTECSPKGGKPLVVPNNDHNVLLLHRIGSTRRRSHRPRWPKERWSKSSGRHPSSSRRKRTDEVD